LFSNNTFDSPLFDGLPAFGQAGVEALKKRLPGNPDNL